MCILTERQNCINIMFNFLLILTICLIKKYHLEAIKDGLIVNYLSVQSLVFTCGGETLEQESEDIFHTELPGLRFL